MPSPDRLRANDVAVSADGGTLYIATTGGLVIASTTTGTITGRIPSSFIDTVALSPDGASAYAVRMNYLVHFDLVHAAVAGTTFIRGFAEKCAVSPDGSRVYDLLSDYGAMDLVDTSAGTFVGQVAHASGGAGVVSTDGNFVFTSGVGYLAVVRTASHQLEKIIEFVGAFNESLALSRDASKAYVPATTSAGSFDVNIAFIDVASGAITNTVPLPDSFGVTAFLTISPDDSTLYLLYGFVNQQLCAIDIATATLKKCAPLPDTFKLEFTTRAIAINQDGTKLYTMSSGNSVAEFDSSSLSLLRNVTISDPDSLLWSLVVAPTGKSLYVVSQSLIDLTGDAYRVDLGTFTVAAHALVNGSPWDVGATPDASKVYVVGDSNSTALFEGSTLTQTGAIPTGPAHGIVIAPR